MKTVIALLLLLTAAIAFGEPTTNAPSVMLAWDKSPDVSVTGYRLYWGVASRTYTNFIALPSASTTNATVSNLARGQRYYFAATALNAVPLESPYSLEVTYDTIPLPPAPGGVKATTVNP